MKKVLSITNVVVINLFLLFVFLTNVNPFDLSLSEIIKRDIEWVFSPSPLQNILMIGSFIGLIIFNVSLIRNRKNNK